MSTHGVRCQCDSSNLIVLPVSFVGCFDLRSFNALSPHRVSSDHKRNCETSGRGGFAELHAGCKYDRPEIHTRAVRRGVGYRALQRVEGRL